MLFHMIPSQEAKLRGNLNNSVAASNSERRRRQRAKTKIEKQPLEVSSRLYAKGNGVKRSSTNASNESSSTSKSNLSNESGICSFMHSNASLSSAESLSGLRRAGDASNGDDTTISSMTFSSSSINRYSQLEENQGNIPQFEVMLDEIPERGMSDSQEQKDRARVDYCSNDSAVVNPRLFISRRNSPSNKDRRGRQSTEVAFPSQFVSSIDTHLATRPRIRPRRIKKVIQSIEVVKAPRAEDDAVVVHEDAVSIFSEQSISKKDKVTNTKKKKMYSISAGELVVNEVDLHEAIELRETGSVISQQQTRNVSDLAPASSQTTEETENKPYRSSRLNESDVAALLQKNRRKIASRSFITKRMRTKNKPLDDGSGSCIVSHNPIKIVNGDDDTGAIEILRTPTDVGKSETWSYDETGEDAILKQEAPPSSPILTVENLQIIGDCNDIEVVTPSSNFKTMRTVEDKSMERIISIQKANSGDDLVHEIPPTGAPMLKDLSTPPKKFEPVIEIPSNRVEGLVDVIRTNSTSSPSRASIPSRSSIISHNFSPSRKAIVRSEDFAPKNGDQLVYVESNQSTSVVVKDVVIPRISGPTRDANSKTKGTFRKSSYYGSKAESFSFADKSSRKVKTEVQGVYKPDGNTNNIEITSVKTPVSTKSEEGSASLAKKYSALVVKEPTSTVSADQKLSIFSQSCSKHVVHVNVLGVAGIVVDRKKCDNIDSPPPSEQMVAVVGISDSYQEFIDDVTTFSIPLVRAPNAHANGDRDTPNVLERHLAVWSSNNNEEGLGCVIKSKLLNLKAEKKNGVKSASKFLELKVALARSSDSIHHSAALIGKAKIEITEDMVNGTKTQSFDIPVRQISENDASRVIILRGPSTNGNGSQKLRVEAFSSTENGREDGLASAYGIDPFGDSMIRVEVEIKEVHETSDEESFKTSKSFANQTIFNADYVASDETEEPGCKVFGRKVNLSNCTTTTRLSDRIDGRLDKLAHCFRNGGENSDSTGFSQRKMLEEMKFAGRFEDLKDLAKELTMSKGKCFFHDKYNGHSENSGVESATRESTEYTSVNRDQDSKEKSSKLNSVGENDSEDSSSMNYLRTLQAEMNPNRRVVSRAEFPALLEVAKFKQEGSYKPSVSSVVESIAEVLSIGGKACGYVSANDVDPNDVDLLTALFFHQEKGEQRIPKTVEQTDNVSVGDLTPITVEKDEIMETNRKLLLKKLGLPKEILAWGRLKTSMINAEEELGTIRKSENYFAEYGEEI